MFLYWDVGVNVSEKKCCILDVFCLICFLYLYIYDVNMKVLIVIFENKKGNFCGGRIKYCF